jgi:hypothetical protein
MHELAIRAKLIQDFEFFAETVLKIIPKGVTQEGIKAGNFATPFILNDTQRQIHEVLEHQLATLGYVRAMILKARQVGSSTYIEGRNYWKVSNQFFKRCLIMTEADTSRDNLFNMVKTYHENIPAAIKPQTKASNEKALIFDTPEGTGLKSRYDVKTCDSKGGLGITTHYVHLSELAYYQDSAIPNVSGLLESIPSESPGIEGTEVVIESTANGTQGLFYDLWKRSEKREREGKDPDFARIFISWLTHTPYQLPVTAPLKEIDDTEERLIKLGATMEQLAWRRWKISKLIPPVGYTPEIMFKQWYPSTPEEAFVFSGRKVFPMEYLEKAKLQIAEPLSEGNIDIGDGKYHKTADKPTIHIWSYPKPGVQYCVGVDVAEGLAHGDFSSFDVLSYPDGAQVMHGNLHIDADQLGVLLTHVGKMYNNATIGVEQNNHGLTTLTTMKWRSYPNVYQREIIDSNSPDKKAKKAGWLTTRKSKYKIIDQLLGLLRDQESGIMNEDTITEMSTYVINEDGDYNAMPKCWDDRVMSFAIAVEVLFSMGSRKGTAGDGTVGDGFETEPDEWG